MDTTVTKDFVLYNKVSIAHSKLKINYTLLRLSHIHKVIVQIDTEAEPRCICITTECMCDNLSSV